MKKRIALFFLSVLCCVLLFALPLSPAAHADIASGTCDDVPWVITDDGELLIGTDGTDTYFMTDAASRIVDSYNWYPYSAYVTSVRFLGTVHGNGSMREMFSGYSGLVSADLRNFRAGTGGYANLSGVFRDCTALRNVQLTGIDSGYVGSFSNMFDGCASLSTLDVSGLNTASATDLSYMFRGCSGLTSLNVSGFTVTNVTNMGGMFQGCTGLQTLTLGNFSTAAPPACYDMFGNCSSLRSLDLTTLDLTGTVTNMFYGLNSLESISFGNYGLVDSQFGSLNHLWGVSDEGYTAARSASAMATAYPNGAGRTFERVIEAGYDTNGGSPDGVVNDIVRLSQGASYVLKTSAAMGITPPGNMEFKAWSYNANSYAPGSAINIASAGTDSVSILAVWRYAVTWTWTEGGTVATASYNDGTPHSVPADSITVLSDTATCDAAGLITRRATVVIGGETYTDDHAVSSPAHHTLTHHDLVPEDCTTDGSLEHWHCSVCSKDFLDANATIEVTDLVIPQTGHNWGAVTYTWAANNRSVTASRVCANNASHVETETRAASADVTTPATCTTKGTTTYTSAAFSNAAFSVQQKAVEDIAELGHRWSAVTYTWSADNRSVTASRTCSRDASHTETETRPTTWNTVEATCDAAESTTYTTTAFTNPVFTVQQKTLQSSPALGHNWGAATYTWSDDNRRVTASRVCTRDANHVETETRPTTAVVNREATCTEKGVRTYTSTAFNNTVFTAQTRTVDDIPALGHNFPAEWKSDGTGHWHICTRCQQRDTVTPHTSSGKATVEHDEHCTVCGFVMTEKLIIRSFAYYDQTGSLALDTVTFTKEREDNDVWLVSLPEEEPELEDYFFEGWSSSRDAWDHTPGEAMLYTYSEARDVTFRGIWTLVVHEGHYDLDADTRYRFAGNRYQISGDDTVYWGDQPFYPASNGSVDITLAGGAA